MIFGSLVATLCDVFSKNLNLYIATFLWLVSLVFLADALRKVVKTMKNETYYE